MAGCGRGQGLIDVANWFYILFLLSALTCYGLDPSIEMTQYARKHWQIEDGLPQNYVSSITQSPDGYLVVATSGGVARFDGVKFAPIPLDQQTGRTREWINAAVVAASGAIWIGARDSGIYRFKSGLTVTRPAWRESPASILVTKDQHVISLGKTGLVELSGASSRLLDSGVRGDSRFGWNGLMQLPDGSLLAATPEGAYRILNGRSVLVLGPGVTGLPHCFAQSRKGGLWIGTAHGLFRSSSASLEAPKEVSGIPGPVVALVEDRDGVVWAGTWGFGLYRVSGSRVSKITYENGLPDDFIHSLFEDAEGDLWIGTRAGLSRWKNGPIVTFGPPEKLNAQFVSAVTGDSGGNLWIGTWRNGLYRMDGSSVQKVQLPDRDVSFVVRTLAVSPKGDVWVGDWSRVPYVKSGDRWLRANVAELDPNGRIECLTFDGQGTLWVATSSGVFAYPEGPVDRRPPVIAGSGMRALLAARDGTLWVGKVNGLARWRKGVVEEAPGTQSSSVRSLTEDSEGRIWVSTSANGISRVDGDTWHSYDQRSGLPAIPCYTALDDGKGSLWLASPAGIVRVPMAQFDELDKRQRDRLEPVVYGQDDGMRSIECQGDGHQLAWKDSQGALWFATVKGVVRVDPGRAVSLAAPRVSIEAIESSADGHSLHFTAPRLSAPGRVEFRYRLDDDAEWSFLGFDRNLRYSPLSPGRHVVSIAARDAGGAWGDAAVAEVFQTPRFHQTWWFRLAGALLSLGVAALLFRWRVVVLEGRYRAVMTERNRIAREWHDTLLAGFSAISWQLDSTLKRLRSNPESAAETIEVARNMVHHYRAEARRVIWDLRSVEPELESLETAIDRALTDLLRGRDVAHQVQVNGRTRQLPPDLAQNLLRICQEASTNAVFHAAPSRIDVTLRFEDEAISLAVRDDGSGFDPERVPRGHFGIDIMRERARRFGGQLELDSAPGRGCIVTVAAPYAEASS
jgi:signal transduction histidine kinase/ligand-binding sensor domain-containing protein